MKSFALAAAFSLAALLLLLTSSWNDSPSWDEPVHVAGGYTNLGFGVNFVGSAHPPLVQDLAGLSVRTLVDSRALKSWRDYRADLCTRELWDGSIDPQRMIRAARLPIIILSSLFVGVLFLSVSERHGMPAGCLAASLLLLCPNYLTHSRFVHTDAAASALIYLSLWFLAGYLRAPSVGRLFGFALVAATAQIAKFSCLILYPIYLIAITVSRQRWSHWKRAPLVGVIFLLLIGFTYRTHVMGPRLAQIYLEARTGGTNTSMARLLKWSYRRPVTRRYGWYLTGVVGQFRHAVLGHDYVPYLAGKLHPGGTHWYFPVLLLVKVPLGILALVVAGFFVRRTWSLEERLFGGFSLLYLSMAIASPLNLGIRHILPVFPCIFALTGCALGPELMKPNGRKLRAAVALALASASISLMLAYPRYVSYFNILAAGRIPAVDSNFDWGTDLHRLAQRATEQGWKPLTIDYFGAIDPGIYLGPDVKEFDSKSPPETGYFVASTSKYLPLLAWVDNKTIEPERASEKARLGRWLPRLELVERVGAIRVFRILPDRDLSPSSGKKAEP